MLDPPTDDNRTIQVPIDSKLIIIDAKSQATLLRIAVTGNLPAGKYQAKTEYWSLRDDLPEGWFEMSLFSSGFKNAPGTGGYEDEIDEFIGDGRVLAAPQEAPPSAWVQGVYKPKAPKRVLLWAEDPDAQQGLVTMYSPRIGLLLERDDVGALVRIVWYKTYRPDNGLIFGRIPSQMSFQVALDGRQAPTTDPAHIDPAATWYFHKSP
ncbi:hypothetical protein WMF31_32410 [Sorangium sp. So ce1036]|uniref:hypothetical protein n=1 Tax=Sorangium sp. So ce1036 TaxID=3133328 RepID=UPI003EFF3D45